MKLLSQFRFPLRQVAITINEFKKFALVIRRPDSRMLFGNQLMSIADFQLGPRFFMVLALSTIFPSFLTCL